MRNKSLLILLILGINILIYGGIFLYVNADKNNRINFLLQQQMNNLQTHYTITTNHFEVIAQSTVDMIQNDKTILTILENYLSASVVEQDFLRKILYNKLIQHYKIIQKHGVLQFHFVSPKNVTILRMHKPAKHSDDLTGVKYSFEYVNTTQKPIRGIERGKTSVSFRDVRPLYSKAGEYLGCVDVAFSPERVQQSLLKSSDIYSNLIFNKGVFEQREWKRNDRELFYRPSSEHPDYYEYSYDEHDESLQQSLLAQHKEKVFLNINNKQSFAVVSSFDDYSYIIAFLVIKNIKRDVIGYLISYTDSNSLRELSRDFYILNMMILLVMVFISYFIYKNIKSKLELEDEKDKYHQLSLYDPLTKLPNRLLLQERLIQYIASAKRHENKFAVLFLDLDNFKYINDTYGHETGDEVLQIVGNKISALIRDGDMLARIGGDEFVLVIEELDKYENSAFVANKIIEMLREPIDVQKTKHYVGASIGISIYPNDAQNSLDLLKHADIAMYRAKDNGKNNSQFYFPEMTQAILSKVTLERELRDAIKNEEFVVHYQIQMNAKTNELIGMEALVRWQHPTKGLLSPFEFIEFAGDSGLIIEIDRLVMKIAIKQFALWYKVGYAPGILSLNLSVKQLQAKGYFRFLDNTLKESGLNKKSLGLEVTEGEIMKSPERAISILQKINDYGIELSIDDFGTGYSSLSYLKRLPIKKLKIDQSFIRDLPDDEEDIAISKAVIALAKSLNLSVIAEGVETEAQKAFLLENGCDLIQGYLYSKPIPAELIEKEFLE